MFSVPAVSRGGRRIEVRCCSRTSRDTASRVEGRLSEEIDILDYFSPSWQVRRDLVFAFSLPK